MRRVLLLAPLYLGVFFAIVVVRSAASEGATAAPATTTTTTTAVLRAMQAPEGPASRTEPERLVVRRPARRVRVADAPAGATWTWDQLAECESNQRWGVVRDIYQGGLQIDARNWDAYRQAHFPDFPEDGQLATREQQIAVAERILARQGLYRGWPTCGPRISPPT